MVHQQFILKSTLNRCGIIWDSYETEAEDVYMVSLKASLEGNAQGLFDRFPPGSVDGYDTFTKKLIEDWSSKPDNRFLLNQPFEVKKKENEIICEFNVRFDKLVSNAPQDLRPTDQAILILYLNAFEGWFGLNLKEKNLNDLKTAQTWAKKAEANITSMGKKKNFNAYAPSSSRSDPKPRRAKEPVVEEKPTLEEMFEMMKSLTLFAKDIAKTRENERYRNSYVLRPYWNN